MKKLIAIAAVAVTGLIAFPDRAEAGSARVSFTYQSGRSSCGCPIYTRRYVTDYDCHRRPIYRYVRMPVVHHCRTYASPRAGHRGHYYYDHSRRYRGPVRHHRYRYRDYRSRDECH